MFTLDIVGPLELPTVWMRTPPVPVTAPIVAVDWPVMAPIPPATTKSALLRMMVLAKVPPEL